MTKKVLFSLLLVAGLLGIYPQVRESQLGNCVAYATGGLRDVAADRAERFLGKVSEDTARCRGGEAAAAWRKTPWLDWPQYWSAGGDQSRFSGMLSRVNLLSPNIRGINGALLDLEYQRMELLKFNLFDNHGTYEEYFRGGSSASSKLAMSWPQ